MATSKELVHGLWGISRDQDSGTRIRRDNKWSSISQLSPLCLRIGYFYMLKSFSDIAGHEEKRLRVILLQPAREIQ